MSRENTVLETSSQAPADRRERYPGRWAAEPFEKIAVIAAATGWTQTYRELDLQARRLAGTLEGAGLRPGDHVLILLENHPRYLEVVWGCHYAGLIYTTCSTKFTAAEVAYIAGDCAARAIVASSATGTVAEQIVPLTTNILVRLMIGRDLTDHLRYEQVVDEQPDAPARSGRVAGADMLYSSGTTGRPKGIVRPFRLAPLETAPIGVSYAAHKFFGFDDNTVYLATTPLYHGAGIRFCLAATALGGTVVYLDRFDPLDALRTIERYAVTHTQMVPTMLRRLVALPEETRSHYDLSSLRSLIHSAAPVSATVKHRIIDWLGPVVVEYYAGTESNGMVLCGTEEWLAHEGTVGRAKGCTVHICNDDGKELPPGQIGGVYFEGGGNFHYHGDEGKTAQSKDVGGHNWSTLGDIGYLDEDGFLYLTDRKAFMIISGGVNVYPKETELRLTEHPDVVEAVVFGSPDLDLGERVVAVVEPAPELNPTQRQALPAQLDAFCRAALSPIKCPKVIDITAALPRDDTGKVLKKQVQAEWIAAHPQAIA